MENVQLSVSDCIALVNQTLDYAYPSVTVVGEVASFKINQGKYVFFDLKDDNGTLSCFMSLWHMRQPLENGMKVMIVAQPKVTQWGKFSLTVRSVQPVGEGSLKRAFDLLVKKLQSEGLFDETRKRPLPFMPAHIGVITSTQAAGYADFIKILNDRWSGLRVDVAHVQVQGMVAPRQIIAALEHFNEIAEPPEIVVIIRGGGSADDLAAFNDEPLTRAIAASRVITVVGVGHEVDTTLADLAADVRAATPSNAAQLIVPEKTEVSKTQAFALKRAAQKIDHQYASLVATTRQTTAMIMQRLDAHWQIVAERRKSLQQTLRQIDPRTVLRRGYALVKNETGCVVKKPEHVQPGSAIIIELEKAIIQAGVTHVQEK